MDDNDSADGYLSRIREDLDIYAGLASGVGLQAAQWITDRPLFEDHLNPWSGDKLAHGGFSYGLTGATYRACEKAANATEGTRLEPYTEQLRDPTYQAALGFGMIGAFTIVKEFGKDPEPDAVDAGANYLGYSTYLIKDHHDIDSWAAEGKELGQRVYDSLLQEDEEDF